MTNEELLAELASERSARERAERALDEFFTAQRFTGVCKHCGKGVVIVRGPVNDLICTDVTPMCRCNYGFNLWPSAPPIPILDEASEGSPSSPLEEAEAYIAALRGPLLHYFGTTDPELLAEVWKDRAEERDAEVENQGYVVSRPSGAALLLTNEMPAKDRAYFHQYRALSPEMQAELREYANHLAAKKSAGSSPVATEPETPQQKQD